MLWRAHRRDHLHQEAVGIEAVDAEIRRRCLDGEMQAGAARGAHHLEALMAGEVDDVEMRAGDLREIERGLDGERLGDRGCASSQSFSVPSGLRVLQLVARRIDQRAGFAVDAGDRIGPERGDSAEAVQQHVVTDRLHDAGHARHVELERADAELLGVARDFLDLLFREDLRMEDRVDVAALVHRLAEGGEVVEVGILQAAQENPDAGDAAQDRPRGSRSRPRFRRTARCQYGCAGRKSRAAPCVRWRRRFRLRHPSGCRRSPRSCRQRSRRRP